MSYGLVRITAAAPGDSAAHYCKDAQGGFTSIAVASGTANYTATTATASGGQNVGSAGDKGLAITSGGWYAPYEVTTAGVNGVVTVDRWYHSDKSKTGQVPTGTMILHTKSAFSKVERLRIKSISGSNITAAAVLTLIDAAAATIEAYTLPVGVVDLQPNLECNGIFGFTIGANTANVSIAFEALGSEETHGSDLRVKNY